MDRSEQQCCLPVQPTGPIEPMANIRSLGPLGREKEKKKPKMRLWGGLLIAEPDGRDLQILAKKNIQ